MSEAKKDIEYYLENPDEMPTDADTLDRLMAARDAKEAGANAEQTGEIDKGASPSVEKQITEDDKGKTEQLEAKTDETKAGEAKVDETKVDGVLAKDGKHFLPYSVLEKTRHDNAELRARAETAQAEIVRLKGSPDAKPDESLTLLSDEDLDSIEEEMPILGKAIRAQQNVLQSMVERQEEDRREEENEQRQVQVTLEQQVEAGKAANPDIIQWETENPVRFDKAVEIDEAIRKDAEWKGKPFNERFKEVVLRTKRFFGDPITETKQGKQEELEDPAKLTPSGLGQIPGGTIPESSTGEAMHNATVTELEAAFENMSIEQINTALAKTA